MNYLKSLSVKKLVHLDASAKVPGTMIRCVSSGQKAYSKYDVNEQRRVMATEDEEAGALCEKSLGLGLGTGEMGLQQDGTLRAKET